MESDSRECAGMDGWATGSWPVHHVGQVSDMSEINRIADNHVLAVIVHAVQSFGAASSEAMAEYP